MALASNTFLLVLGMCIGMLMAWRLLRTTAAVEDALTGTSHTEARPKVPSRGGGSSLPIVEDRVLLPAASLLGSSSSSSVSAAPSAAPTSAAPSSSAPTTPPTVPRIRKVLVPAIYKEWQNRYPPFWFWNTTFQKEYGYEVVLYQKLNASAPFYIATNRGCENGAYFNYIVDHYHDFPDIAVFVHARPEEHMTGNGLGATMMWLDSIKCLRPDVTYQSLNVDKFFCRSSWNGIWAKKGIWIEQCLRDTLQAAWDLEGNSTAFHLRVPPNQPIQMCTHCCQQFAVSRQQVLKRPLSVWRRLRDILSVQDQCHVGEPDYENLYAFHRSQKMRLGPEPVNLSTGREGTNAPGYGRYTQAVAAEHLAHVIFGGLPLEMRPQTMADLCASFEANTTCPGSPCEVPG